MLKVSIFLLLVLSNNECVSGKTTAEDEPKHIAGTMDLGSKNYTSLENNLTPHPAHTITDDVDFSRRYECKDSHFPIIDDCPTDGKCSDLGAECLDCRFNCSCVYGESLNVKCQPKHGVECTGERHFNLDMVCRYCYQSPTWQYDCSGTADCPAVDSPRRMFKANCSMKSDVICLGRRKFLKMIPCNWTSGYRWSTALLLSVTLGGFGADRFYLGHWQEGIGKLFSFGGLGVWTIMDVILIAVRYLGPANNSLYM